MLIFFAEIMYVEIMFSTMNTQVVIFSLLVQKVAGIRVVRFNGRSFWKFIIASI